jgi:3-hydroxybutyryl-CoA dehydrogenase
LGAGRMGQGLAHVFAYAGHDVTLIDLKARADDEHASVAANALSAIESNLRDCAAAGLFAADDIPHIIRRVQIKHADVADAELACADFVFEGVPEVIELKRAAFAHLSGRIRDDAIVASTTSTILSDELAAFVAKPERFLNAHWLNPAYLIPLVEVSPAANTSAKVTEKLLALLAGVGKETVVCKASPGFIIPRIQALAMNEAARMVEEGVASAEDMDRAIRYGFGFRFGILGLIEFIDWGGGDILFYASQYLAKSLDAPRFEAPAIINTNMQTNRLGIKTAAGFYDYESMDLDAYKAETLSRFVDMLRHVDKALPPVVSD